MLLAQRGHHVCLIDFDAQSNSSTYCGARPRQALYEMLVRGAEHNHVWEWVDPAVYQGSGALHIIPTNDETNYLIPEQIQSELVVPDRLSEIQADYIVVDTSPSMTRVHTGLYFAADWVILPTQCERWSIDGLASSLEYLRRAHEVASTHGQRAAAVLGILPTMFEKRKRIHEQMLAYLKECYGDFVLDQINYDVRWKEAAAQGVPINVYARRSRAAKQAGALVDRVEAARV
jgi:chromosome partitioning protein